MIVFIIFRTIELFARSDPQISEVKQSLDLMAKD
jgi:hypothetical protein